MKVSQQERWEPAQIPQLRIGQYIRIDHRWFDHPFVRRMFQISSERELEIIRETALTRIFVDTARTSENTPAPAEAGSPPSEGAAEPAAPDSGAAGLSLRAERDGLAAAQARLRETLERAQYAFAALNYGDPNSATHLDEFVDYLVALLNNSTSPLALLASSVPGHSAQRLALLGSDAVTMAAVIGKRMRLPKEALRELTRAAAAHVLGLSRLPQHLFDEEADGVAPRSAVYRDYPLLGARILEQCGGFSGEVQRIVREHRERPDGSGFPQGLAGAAIHPHALIIGAVREFQLRSSSGRSPGAALANMNRHLRQVFGTDIIGHLAMSLLMYPVGTLVQLSDGRVARVARSDEAMRVSPVVEVFEDINTLRTRETVDLSQRRDLSIVRVLDTSRLPPKMFAHGKRFTVGGSSGTESSGDPAPQPAASVDAAGSEAKA